MRPRIFPVGKTAPASRSTNLDHPDRDAESSIDGSVILVGGLAEPAGEVVVQVLRVEFGRYFNGVDGEVLLWVPDIVAGAVGAARGDGDFQFVEPIRDLLVEIDIEFH
jgi:hypothetical protein